MNVLNNPNKVVIVYLIYMFALINGSFFSYLFQFVGLDVWRQCFWGIFVFYTFYKLNNCRYVHLINLKRKIPIVFLVFVLLFCFTVLHNTYNYTRIVFCIYNSLFGFAFIGFGYALSQSSYSETILYKFLYFTGLFVSIGLILDANTGFFTSTFKYHNNDIVNEEWFNDRYCFLAESPTIFGVLYSFCIYGGFNIIYTIKTKSTKYIILALNILFFLGAFYTGTRQIIISMAIVFVINLFVFLHKSKSLAIFPFFVLIIFISIICWDYFVQGDNINKLIGRYANDSSMQDIDSFRIKQWLSGVDEFILSGNLLKILLGNGLGYVSSKAILGEVNGSNYENTFFVCLSNEGIFGLLLFVYPLLCIYKYCNRNIDIIHVWSYYSMLLSYLSVSFLSPNGNVPTSLMCIYIIWGMLMADIDNKKTRSEYNL